MGAIELSELHFVAGPFKLGDQPPAGAIDGKDLILCPVRNKEARSAALFDTGRDETWRKGDYRTEQVAVGQAKSQRVRGSIRKTRDRDLPRVHTTLGEDLGQGLIDKSYISSVAGADRVPCAFLRGW